MAVFDIRINKEDVKDPLFTLVQHDAYTQIVRVHVLRWFGGVDLAGLAWTVKFIDSWGTTGVSVLKNIQVSDKEIIADWELDHLPTIVAGKVEFAVRGLLNVDDEHTMVWQSGRRNFNVSKEIEGEPMYDDQHVNELDEFFASVIAELPSVLEARDAAAEATEAAIQAVDELLKALESTSHATDRLNVGIGQLELMTEATRKFVDGYSEFIANISRKVNLLEEKLNDIADGYVSSVNGKNGAVRLTSDDVGSLPVSFRDEAKKMIDDAINSIVNGNEVAY